MSHAVSVGVGSRRHASHHGWVDLAAAHGVASKLMRHASARATLASVGGHSGAHGMATYAGMIHACRVSLKVGADTSCHDSLVVKVIRLPTSVDTEDGEQVGPGCVLLHPHATKAEDGCK